MDERGFEYEDNLAGANAAEFSDDGDDLLLPGLADSVAASAGDPEEALVLCRDLANAEDLDEDQYLRLVALVEGATGWELPEEGERF
jgi:hypothetical protein